VSPTSPDHAPRRARRFAFADTGSYPTRAGNRVTPWIDGEPAFRRICEAIEAARHSVWATVTFMWPSFQMPDGRGAALDVLELAADRGIDVRVIFWRPDEETASLRQNAFWGSSEHFEALSRRYPRVNIRWDRAHPGYCQHQKTWLIDATGEGATSFVGGINLNPHSMVRPDHRGEGHNHDVYIEVAGPAVADAHHNFVQRWNEASERRLSDGRWGDRSGEDLDYPAHTPARRGDALVQIQRTTHAGLYSNGHPPPGGKPFPIELGERTNLDQYCAAIRAAQQTIYLENQYLEVPEIIGALEEALTRGVQVVALLPAVPVISRQAPVSETEAAALARRAGFARHENFTLCGMAGLGVDGGRKPVYVHSKLILVDDEWASVGSCNLHRYSLFGNGELNAAYYAPASVRAMRVALFQEHLGVSTSELRDTEALILFRRIAHENRKRHEANDPDWQGMAFALDVATYGVEPQF
jgi:cardiolipin synthase A/B